jgi:hypothetical protein
MIRTGDVTEELVDDRLSTYGEVVPTFARIAQVWSGILDHEVQPYHVPLLMAGLKLVRAEVSPCYSDNSDDVDGYVKIFREIIGPDMIEARSVKEYLEKLEARDATAVSS